MLLCAALTAAAVAPVANQTALLDALAKLQQMNETDPAGLAKLIRESEMAAIAPEIGDVLARDPKAGALPSVLAHGMGDSCFNAGMKSITKAVGAHLGTYSTCPTIGGNEISETIEGFLIAGGMDAFVDKFAKKVRADPELKNGFNCIGFSQGNSVCRGYIQKYNDPPVKNFLSVHGTVMGVQGFPQCNPKGILGVVCRPFSELLGELAYINLVQKILFQADYLRVPTKVSSDIYLKNSQLAQWNNEGTATPDYKTNFLKTDQFIMVKALKDTMVFPNEGEWWGSFEDGGFSKVVTMKDTRLYKEDLFGLKTADEAGRIKFETTPGNHLQFTQEQLLGWLDKYF